MSDTESEAKPIGAIPGGLTQAEWSALTPEQQTQFINGDAKTQQDVRNMLREGVSAAVALAQAGIQTEQNRLDRENQLELQRIQARTAIELARIQAESGQPVNVTTKAPAPTTTTPVAASSGPSLGTIVIGGVLLYALSRMGKGRR